MVDCILCHCCMQLYCKDMHSTVVFHFDSEFCFSRRQQLPTEWYDGCLLSSRRSFSFRLVASYIDLDARAEAAKVQPKNVWAEAEPNFSWAEAGKCLSQPSRAGKILSS